MLVELGITSCTPSLALPSGSHRCGSQYSRSAYRGDVKHPEPALPSLLVLAVHCDKHGNKGPFKRTFSSFTWLIKIVRPTKKK